MPKRTRYSPEQIERGLTALILAGSSDEASQVCDTPATTLRDWKAKYPDQYARLQKDLEPTIVDKIAGESEGMVVRIFGLQHATLDQYQTTMHELKPAEAAAASRNLATTSALYVDKHSSPLRERPSHVQGEAGVEKLMTRMIRLLGQPVHVQNQAIEGNAVPIESNAVPLSTESVDSNASVHLASGLSSA